LGRGEYKGEEKQSENVKEISFKGEIMAIWVPREYLFKGTV
jgi:hypothetical protein